MQLHAPLPRPAPDWLITDDHDDIDLGRLKAGKEAEIEVVERVERDTGRSCLLAHKRYRPRRVTKGELAERGFQRSAGFLNDHVYRDGRQFAKSRDQRAAERMTNYGKELLTKRWPGHELEMLQRLWAAGARVPYPVESTEDGLLMQYLGDHAGAAPRLAQARLSQVELQVAWGQLLANLTTMTAAGVVHSDLSTYNLLWWKGEVWVIDLPQSVDVAVNPHALDFLHRDVANVCEWFAKHGVDCDTESLFSELLEVALSGG